MLSRSALISTVCRRQLHAGSAVRAQDQIQKMFQDKIKEYAQKQGSAKGGLVDPTPASEKALDDELQRLAKVYKMTSTADAKTFPQIKFEEPTYEPNRMFGNPGEYSGQLQVEEGKTLKDYL